MESSEVQGADFEVGVEVYAFTTPTQAADPIKRN